MKISINVNGKINEKRLIFCLPTIVILSQFISIGPIRLSWIIYLYLAFFVHKRLPMLKSKTTLKLLFGITILYPLISFIWSHANSFETELYFSLITGVIYSIFIVTLEKESFRIFLNGCFFSCVLFTIWGAYEALTGNYIIFRNEDFIFRHNPFGFYYPGVAFPNTNDLAQYLVMLTPIVTTYKWNKRWKVFNGLIIGMIICEIFVTYQCFSHLGMISLVLSMGIIIFGYIFYNMKKAVFWPILIVTVIFVVWVSISTGLPQQIYNDVMLVERTNIHYTGRESIYLSLFDSALDHPFGGFGNAYQIATPHNFFLYVLCDFGFIVAILFIFLIVDLTIQSFKFIENNLLLGIFATMIAFPLTSSISSGNEQRKIVWLILGIGMRYISGLRYAKKYAKNNRNKNISLILNKIIIGGSK